MAQATDVSRPENVTVGELRQYLTEVEGTTATRRIKVGIDHKEGTPQTTLAERYDVSRTTVHNWLNRLERLADEPLEDVVYDDDRPGRPSKLDDEQRERLADVLEQPPDRLGYNTTEWTPRLVREYVRKTFDVDYSLSHVRDLLRENVLSPSAGEDDASTPENVGHREHSEGTSSAPADEPDDDEVPPHRVHGCRT